MKLYHGSNVEVKAPKIIDSGRALDFGKGFYLTSDYEQARKWAISTTERRQNGVPTISVYEINQQDMRNLSILEFDSANKEWLQFVANNRKNVIIDNKWDIVIGPVANDNTMPVISLYLRGYYNEEEAITRLLTQRLKEQYTFKSEKSIVLLKFEEAIQV